MRESREKIHIAVSFTLIFNETYRSRYKIKVILHSQKLLCAWFALNNNIAALNWRHWTWIWLPRSYIFPFSECQTQDVYIFENKFEHIPRLTLLLASFAISSEIGNFNVFYHSWCFDKEHIWETLYVIEYADYNIETGIDVNCKYHS